MAEATVGKRTEKKHPQAIDTFITSTETTTVTSRPSSVGLRLARKYTIRMNAHVSSRTNGVWEVMKWADQTENNC